MRNTKKKKTKKPLIFGGIAAFLLIGIIGSNSKESSNLTAQTDLAVASKGSSSYVQTTTIPPTPTEETVVVKEETPSPTATVPPTEKPTEVPVATEEVTRDIPVSTPCSDVGMEGQPGNCYWPAAENTAYEEASVASNTGGCEIYTPNGQAIPCNYHFSNCDEVHQYFPYGYGRDEYPELYSVNPQRDRDKDGYACEVD